MTMQEQKIVDYKLCQRLAELKFECPSHTGWWYEEKFNTPDYPDSPWWSERDVTTYVKSPLTGATIDKRFKCKAYDCWDLLMWLMMNYTEVIKRHLNLTLFRKIFSVGANWVEDGFMGESKQPQNALAKAIIKILEERQ